VRLGVLALVAACSGEPAQHQITEPGDLLTDDGRVREAGWSPRQLLQWDPARVADPTRLRQWDFVTVLDERAAVNLALVDLGFLRVATVGAVDLATGEKSDSVFIAGPADAFVLSGALEGTASLTPAGAATPVARFESGAESSTFTVDIAFAHVGPPASGALTLRRRATMPYLSLVTPFADEPQQFFFEQKVPGMVADGTLTAGGRSFTFSGATAVIDWGRGQWPSQVTWRWAAASGVVDGVPLALNLGEGFGDASAATENLLVLGDVPHKLGEVGWSYDRADPTRDWTFRSDDGRVDLVLEPIAPEVGGIELGSKFQRVFKAYGRWRGALVLDDGRRVAVDGLLGFAENVDLSW